jgi:hypothetical protein
MPNGPKPKALKAAARAGTMAGRSLADMYVAMNQQRFQKFLQTLPPNLRTTDTATYNMMGYWDALGRPAAFDYNQPKESDGAYHAFSRHPGTGEILKKSNHPTFRQALEEDARAGYFPYVSPDGRVFTFSKDDKVPAGYKPYKL